MIRIITLLLLFLPVFNNVLAKEFASVKNELKTREFINNRTNYNSVMLNGFDSNLWSSESVIMCKQKLDSMVINSWNISTSDWYVNEKYEFIYDEKGKTVKYNYFEWEKMTDKWVNSYKEEYIYANDYLTQYIDYYWDKSMGKWINDDKEEYTYNSSGDLTQYVTCDWDTTNGSWLNSFKGEFAYSGNLLIKYISYFRDEADLKWIASYKIEYAYDQSGNVTGYNGYSVDETTGNWKDSYKGEYQYDAGGQLIYYITSYYDLTSGHWIADSKEEYSYDTNGRLIQAIEYYWDAYRRRWLAGGKQEYGYDGIGNMIWYCEFYRNQYGNEWIPTYKEEYTYNNTYSYSELIVPDLYDDSNEIAFNHMRVSCNSYEWDETLNKWINYREEIFYYSDYHEVGDFPVAVNDTFFIMEDSLLAGSVSLNDTLSKDDTNIWKLTEDQGPQNGDINSWDTITGEFTYLPNPDYYGEDSFAYSLQDSYGNCDSAKVDILISAVNDPPYIVGTVPDCTIYAGQSDTIYISSEKGILFDDVDAGDSLLISISSVDDTALPDFMTFSGDTLYITPLPADTGDYTIFIKATDLHGEYVFLTFQLNVYVSTINAGDVTDDHLNIKIYPNPVTDYLFFHFSGKFYYADFSLFTINGKKILHRKITPGQKLNLKYLPSASYIYTISSEGKFQQGKLIKK
jgi:hypothetical protein